MPSYSVREVERVLRLSRSTIRGLIAAGFVTPERGTRREYRFSFQDLIVLRTASALIAANVSRRRIRRSLEDLRRHLPASMPLCGLSVCAVGDRVVVRRGESRWEADNGQYLLGLEAVLQNGVLQMIERTSAAPAAASPPTRAKTADQWFTEALELETADARAARLGYERALGVDPRHVASWINLGRLLHEQGAIHEADATYRRAIEVCGEDSLLLYNRGVLLEDLGDAPAALQAYRAAIGQDPELADCHYNLARLYESVGKPHEAIRHLLQYRRLMSHSSH